MYTLTHEMIPIQLAVFIWTFSCSCFWILSFDSWKLVFQDRLNTLKQLREAKKEVRNGGDCT